jgi:hypothetical protein
MCSHLRDCTVRDGVFGGSPRARQSVQMRHDQCCRVPNIRFRVLARIRTRIHEYFSWVLELIVLGTSTSSPRDKALSLTSIFPNESTDFSLCLYLCCRRCGRCAFGRGGHPGSGKRRSYDLDRCCGCSVQLAAATLNLSFALFCLLSMLK